MRVVDDFSPILTTGLRRILCHFYPQIGAARMKRRVLVDTLLQKMVQEEAQLIRTFRRRSRSNVPLDGELAFARRHLQERYDTLCLSRYFASRMRAQHSLLRSLSVIFDHDPTVSFSQESTERTFTQRSASPAWSEDTEAGRTELPEWPQIPTSAGIKDRMQQFHDETDIAVGPTCAVCARRSFTKDVMFLNNGTQCQRIEAETLRHSLYLLKIHERHILDRQHERLHFDHPLLEGLALEKAGVHIDRDKAELDVCQHCLQALSSTSPTLPALALANGNIRGWLPPYLQDCTWLEERLCARFLASAYVFRMFDTRKDGSAESSALPRAMKGHACSFPLNTISTAVKLPRAFDDGSPLLSCIVIGPRAPRKSDLAHIFKVRRQKVEALLLFLRANFVNYPQFPIDVDALNQLPDDDVPELLMRYVVHQETGNVPSLFEQETSGMETHPGTVFSDGPMDANPATFLEHHGLIDINGVSVPAHARMAAGLAQATGMQRPDLVIRHGSEFLRDYSNPALFPGMYPLLFPWGTGGFEGSRCTPLSFQRQSAHMLDLADPAFRRHWSYIFMVANIKSRRQIHLGSRFVCKAQDFEHVSEELRKINLQTVQNVATLLANGGSLRTLSHEEARVTTLLKKCELVSNRVPGSKAAMNLARAEIRGYIAEFGIFQLFVTLNPSAVHSPVFQVFYGDEEVDLGVQIPSMPNARTRATRVADDPVAASDYFHFHLHAVFAYLLGWDFCATRSTDEGGLFGHLAAFYVVKEHTMRGQLHGHALIWLKGGLNPGQLREKLGEDTVFRQRYLDFLDSLVQHHLPDLEAVQEVSAELHAANVNAARNPRQERPPNPSMPGYASTFIMDHKLLGEAVQRHRCTPTCFKGGRKTCRFLYPHSLHGRTSYNPTTKSVELQVLDATCNPHNRNMLVATRHNQDVQVVQSGRGGVATASYITMYATKSEETPFNQVSMIQTVYERSEALGEDAMPVKSLLTKCAMQYGRERQMHAQQAATYVRGLGDTWQSHTCKPLLSARMIQVALQRNGPLQNIVSEQDASMLPTHGEATRDGPLQNSVVEQGVSTLHTDAEAPEGSNIAPADSPDDLSQEEGGYLPLLPSGTVHQVNDYLHRGSDLSHVCFYDFVRFSELVDIPKKPNRYHYQLAPTHPNVEQKCHRYDTRRTNAILRPIFSSFPRSDGSALHGEYYCLAMLSHFIPFSISQRLKAPEQSYRHAFANARFTSHARRVMDNWAALTECEDARDAEQLLRRKREAHQAAEHDCIGAAMVQPLHDGVEAVGLQLEAEEMGQRNQRSEETLQIMATLASSGWFQQSPADGTAIPAASDGDSNTPIFTAARRRQWASEISSIESNVRDARNAPRATTGVLAEDLGFGDEGEAPDTTLQEEFASAQDEAPETIHVTGVERSPQELIELLAEERQLTPSQRLAFGIAAKHFYKELYGLEPESLRLFLHGEAGTGKTVVVQLLKELLERYGKGRDIVLMAPTGKAACAIGGTTQHSSFALDIRNRGTLGETLGSEQLDTFTARRIRYLQTTFSDVKWIFLDEVSMTSCEVLAEIDQSLRIGRQRPNLPFGGVNMLFAGDLCQLPPVRSAALYSQASLKSKTAEAQTKVELGRAAWKQVNAVVNFTEQMRMRDADMAQALGRLRLRSCTDEDAALFNRNVLRSPRNPAGRQLEAGTEAIVITRTNETVRNLNHQRAMQYAQAAGKRYTICHAHDRGTSTMTKERRDDLLNFGGNPKLKIGLGRIPLFKGMPVVYRGANQSVPLGITNGAFATVEGWDLQVDEFGYYTPRGIVLNFGNDAVFRLTDLPESCLPVSPTRSSFKYAGLSDADGVETIKRQQFPIQPGFAMTIHSAQGITSHKPIIIDLRRGGFEAYVAASRATRREDIMLVTPITAASLNSPALPKDLRSELLRLDILAAKTQHNYEQDEWDLSGVDTTTDRRSSSGPSRDALPSSHKRRRLGR